MAPLSLIPLEGSAGRGSARSPNFAETRDAIRSFEWEPYQVAEDFSLSENLAEKHAERLAEMQFVFYGEAAKYNVTPASPWQWGHSFSGGQLGASGSRGTVVTGMRRNLLQ